MNKLVEHSTAAGSAIDVVQTLSIVIPSYNSDSAALAGVTEAAQALGPMEILIVDSSPSPPTISSARVIHSKTRLNAAEARNLGAQQARGSVILFLDSDVVLHAEAVEEVRAFLAQPDGAVCGLYSMNESDNWITSFQNRILRYRLSGDIARSRDLWSSSHFLIRRVDFSRTGGFNETLARYEDMEFFLRIRYLGIQVRVAPEFLGTHLKQFSFLSLIEDYARKAYCALTARWGNSRFLRKHDGGIPAALHATGISAILALFAAIVIPILEAFTAISWLWLSMPSVLLIFACIIFPNDADLSRRPFERVVAVLAWMCCYGAILVAIATAVTVLARLKIYTYTLETLDYFRLGIRVLLRTGMPVQVVNYVTARCNLRCQHCFYKETLDSPDPGELSREVLQRAMRQIGPVLWYSLAGGEPFIRRDLEEIIGDAQRLCRPKVFSFPTNGWYTQRTFTTVQRVLQRLSRGNLVLFFSVDGPPELHDLIRGENSFRHLKETLERLRPLKALYGNLYLNVVTTITPTNAAGAESLIRSIVRDLEPDAISVNLFRHHTLNGPKVPNTVIDAYKCAVETYDEETQAGKLKGYGFVGRRILRAKEFLQKEMIYRVAKYDEFVAPCTAGTLSYVIMEDGAIKPCEILSDTIGNVKNPEGFVGAIRSMGAKRLRGWIKDTKCKCTYECAMSTNTLFSWPMPLKMAAEILRR